jgi:hypothetical protein
MKLKYKILRTIAAFAILITISPLLLVKLIADVITSDAYVLVLWLLKPIVKNGIHSLN